MRLPADVLGSLSLLESVAFLADLHRVRAITARHLITTLPPPSVLRAGIFAPRSSGQAVAEFPSSARKCTRNP